MTHDADRWTDVSNRLACGETLSAEEARWVEEKRASDPACAAELQFLEELARFDEQGADASASASELVRAALAELDRPDDAPATTAAAPRVARRRWWWIAVPIVAAAAAVALVVALDGEAPPPSSHAVTIAHGDVFLDGHPLAETDGTLVDGTTLAVGDGGACLQIDARIDVCLEAATTVTVRSDDADAQALELLRGRAVARLEPLEEGRTFALVHGDVSAQAIGTVFALAVDPEGGEVTASVLQGRVRVDTAGEGIELGAHEVAAIRGTTIDRATLSAEQEAADLAMLAAARDAARSDVGRLVVDCTPPATVVLDGAAVGRSPVVVSVPAGAHRVELVAAGGTAIHEALAVEAGQTTRRRFELGREVVAEVEPPEIHDAVSEPSAIDPVQPTPEPSAAEVVDEATEVDRDAAPHRPKRPIGVLLDEARHERQAGRWSAAARAYSELVASHPRSAEARTALVSLGDLQLDRLGKPMAAARSYGLYLARGGGPLAQEARYGRVRAYRAAGEPRLEARAIAAYLEHHPTSARVGGLKTRLKELER